jgi:hypothetical protein
MEQMSWQKVSALLNFPHTPTSLEMKKTKEKKIWKTEKAFRGRATTFILFKNRNTKRIWRIL